MKKLFALIIMIALAFTLCACTFSKACSVCEGKKAIKCVTCDGKGKRHFIYCEECGGNGTIIKSCPRCNPGNHSSQCSVCDGEFTIKEVCKYSDNERCSICDGVGLTPCYKCNKQVSSK